MNKDELKFFKQQIAALDMFLPNLREALIDNSRSETARSEARRFVDCGICVGEKRRAVQVGGFGAEDGNWFYRNAEDWDLSDDESSVNLHWPRFDWTAGLGKKRLTKEGHDAAWCVLDLLPRFAAEGITSRKREHRREKLAQAVGEYLESRGLLRPLGLSDGPFDPDGFRWRNCEYRGLNSMSFVLVKVLWNSLGRAATFLQLAVSVWGDGALDEIDVSRRFGTPRAAANRFFEWKRLPFRVASKRDEAGRHLAYLKCPQKSEKIHRKAP